MPNAPQRLSGSAQLLIDSVCTRFEEAWQPDRSQRIEQWLGEVTAELQADLLRELIALEIELRTATGERPDAEDYLARFTEQAEVVRQAFADSEALATTIPLDATQIDTSSSGSLSRTIEFTSAAGSAPIPGEIAGEIANLRLPGYRVDGLLGRGGMGLVVRAWDEKLHRGVAIKLLLPKLASDERYRQRFLREARASAAIRHPNVVTIHAVEADHDPPYLVLELVEGITLADRLESTPVMPIDDVVRIASDLAAGLAAAHAKGIVHRDIKPGNVLLESHDGRARLTDFGLARASAEVGVTTTGQIAGTPQFMSPEQVEGRELDPRSDLFSLGAVLYRMVSGENPFNGESVITLARQICDLPPRPIRDIRPNTPAWLHDLVERLLSKRPDERIQSADELVRLLKEMHSPASGHSVGFAASTRGEASSVASAARGTRGWAVPVMLIVVLLAIGLTSWNRMNRRTETTSESGSSHSFSGQLAGQSQSPSPSNEPRPVSSREQAEPSAPPLAVAPFDATQARAHQEAWAKHLGLPVEKVIELPENQSLTLVLIPPGEFQMGSPDTEQSRLKEINAKDPNPWFLNNLPSEGPQHHVRLTRPFYLAKYELTQGQWLTFMEQNPSAHTTSLMQPVEHLNWHDTQLFLEKLNARVNVSGLKFVLPSEAQWEFACRAGTQSWFSFDGADNDLTKYGWHSLNTRQLNEQTQTTSWPTHPVGELLPNHFGLHDMHGNVWEWCKDWFDPKYYAQSPQDDPAGPPSGKHRVGRGGYAAFRSDYSRSAMRGHDDPFRRDFHGVRVAAAIESVRSSQTLPSKLEGRANPQTLNWDALTMLRDSGQRLGRSDTAHAASGDLDGDGDLDLVVACGKGNDPQPCEIWLNDGHGKFEWRQSLESQFGPRIAGGVALGDVNGDGHLDVWVANWSDRDGEQGSDSLWLNDGLGHFTESPQQLDPGNGVGVALADVDGDGDLDAWVANFRQSEQLWLNDGRGQFTASGQKFAPLNTIAVAFGHLNSDQAIDAVTFSVRAPHLQTWLNDGRGQFKSGVKLTCGTEVVKGFLADLNGDSRPDAVACSDQGLCVFLLQANGEFIPGPTLSRDDGICQASAVDLNGDGSLDLIFVDRTLRETLVAINQGEAQFAAPQRIPNLVGVQMIVGADFDRDGDQDLYLGLGEKEHERAPDRVLINLTRN